MSEKYYSQSSIMNGLLYDLSELEAKQIMQNIEIDGNGPADVAPVVHGHWVISSDGYYPFCSRCKKEPKNGVLSKFCPECGAKMNEEESGNE